MIFAPKLDKENPKDFVEHFGFDEIFETYILVEHWNEKNVYWYIAASDCNMIYKPQLVD